MAAIRMAAIRMGAIFAVLSGAGAVAQPAPADHGMQVFKSANCVGCHKWTGAGGGGYGGAAANLRQTKLSLTQIEETIRCGRPGTGMPHFAANAYSDGRCFGLKASDLVDGQKPPEPDHPLRPSDIQAVATYVETHIKGKGEPDLAQCQAFFGTGTRVCDMYEPHAADSSPHGHPKVEAATDANDPVNSGRK